jgi:hypothetical protein
MRLPMCGYWQVQPRNGAMAELLKWMMLRILGVGVFLWAGYRAAAACFHSPDAAKGRINK